VKRARRPKSAGPLEGVLAAVAAAASEPSPEAARAALAQALADPSQHAAARAAAVASERGFTELEEELCAAFSRFMNEPAECDPNCTAKAAIVVALSALERPAWEVFQRGLEHVQIEPSYGAPGGKADTAGGLRGSSAVALAKSRDPGALHALIERLVDPERAARVGAAQALGVLGVRESIGVLRLKALTGDDEPEVLSECFLSLLAIDPGPSLAFVSGLLTASPDPSLQETAALAIGQSRVAGAFEVLDRARSSAGKGDLARVILVAMAILRQPAATERLLGIVRAGELPAAGHALAALAAFRGDPQLRARVQAAVEEAGAPRRLAEILQREFSS